MNALPAKYAWLQDEAGPRMLLEALKLYGTVEVPGTGNSPIILAWADEIAIDGGSAYETWAARYYAQDSIPWCGLFMAIVAMRANVDKRPDRDIPDRYLSAVSWGQFGVKAASAELGDVLVFVRDGGGHVALYVGEDAETYHCLGGNQGDRVSITRISKGRCIAIRRVPYLVKPTNVRKVLLKNDGVLSTNEA